MDRRRFYDRLSRYYCFVRLFDNCYKKKALDAFKLRHGMRFLDTGCGDGHVLCQAKSRCPEAEFFGVDNSLKMAACAKKSAVGCISVGDCFCLPYRSGSFDVLFCSFVFDLFDEKEQERILSEFGRVLVPQGMLVLVNNSCGRGIFSYVAGFYVFLARLFPNLLLNKPIDTCSIIEKSWGFEIKNMITLWFTDIVVCKKSIVKARTI